VTSNPFAAPRHDSSELPVVAPPKKNRALSVLGVFEMVLGAGLIALAVLGGGAELAEERSLTSSSARENLGYMVVFIVMGGLCACAGYKLTRRFSWTPLLLQVFPVLVALVLFLGVRTM
jgi:hypothetical protein